MVILEAGKESTLAYLMHRDSDHMTIKLEDNTEKYQILKVIEFDSDRKMMTLVVKNEQTGKILVFSKGAESVIFPRVKD